MIEWLYFLSIPVMGAITIYYAFVDVRQRRTIRRLKAIIEHTKHSQYVRELGFDVDECEYVHLPGDCPLCGGVL